MLEAIRGVDAFGRFPIFVVAGDLQNVGKYSSGCGHICDGLGRQIVIVVLRIHRPEAGHQMKLITFGKKHISRVATPSRAG